MGLVVGLGLGLGLGLEVGLGLGLGLRPLCSSALSKALLREVRVRVGLG